MLTALTSSPELSNYYPAPSCTGQSHVYTNSHPSSTTTLHRRALTLTLLEVGTEGAVIGQFRIAPTCLLHLPCWWRCTAFWWPVAPPVTLRPSHYTPVNARSLSSSHAHSTLHAPRLDQMVLSLAGIRIAPLLLLLVLHLAQAQGTPFALSFPFSFSCVFLFGTFSLLALFLLSNLIWTKLLMGSVHLVCSML
jgi:hypothetical protein